MKKIISLRFVSFILSLLIFIGGYAITAYGSANGTSGGTTSTSAGNIYVSEFNGAANQLWKIESGGIQLNNADNIKNVTIKDSVPEGRNYGQFFCPVTEFGETVSWSSNNAHSVSITSNGTATTVKAGKANITATVTHTNGTTTTYSCAIYVVIQDGVYCFHNVETGYRIEYEDPSDYSEGAVMEVYDSSDVEGEEVPNYALFKIKYLGSGKYSIRSMLRNDMGWTCSNNYRLVMTNIGTSDNEITNYSKWCISYDTSDDICGYYIKNLYDVRTIVASEESGDNITLDDYQTINVSKYWTLTRITDGIHGVTIRDKVNALKVGENTTFTAVMYSSYPTVNGQNGITWSVTDGDEYASIDSTTGLLIGISPGTVVVTATYKLSSYQQWSASYTVVIKERYLAELVDTYGFSSSEAVLIRSLYDKVDSIFPGETNIQRAWKCSRLLGGLVYNQSFKNRFYWNDVAGKVFDGLSNYSEAEKQYFVNTLGFTESQYSQLKTAVQDQYNDTKPDFAHFQISLSARLAYTLGKDGCASNLGTFCSDEDVSYLAGWLGDATIAENGTTSLANDDYCADLDAENTYRLIFQGYSSVDAFSEYYCLFTDSINRATIFLNYINYGTVEYKVFYELIDKDLFVSQEMEREAGNIGLVYYYASLLDDEEYHWNTIRSFYPDTYDFLLSLQNHLANMEDYQ